MPSEAAECIDCGELIPILGPCPHCDAAPDRRVDPVTWAATKPPEAVKVTQEDRDAAALLARDLGTLTRMEQAGTINGGADSGCYVQAFARHREEAEKRIVDWLRGQSQSLHMRAVEEAQGDNDRDYMAMLVGHSAAYASAAGEVERGDHIQENSDGE